MSHFLKGANKLVFGHLGRCHEIPLLLLTQSPTLVHGHKLVLSGLGPVNPVELLFYFCGSGHQRLSFLFGKRIPEVGSRRLSTQLGLNLASSSLGGRANSGEGSGQVLVHIML